MTDVRTGWLTSIQRALDGFVYNPDAHVEDHQFRQAKGAGAEALHALRARTEANTSAKYIIDFRRCPEMLFTGDGVYEIIVKWVR